jgi:hypothetical protein
MYVAPQNNPDESAEPISDIPFIVIPQTIDTDQLMADL